MDSGLVASNAQEMRALFLRSMPGIAQTLVHLHSDAAPEVILLLEQLRDLMVAVDPPVRGNFAVGLLGPLAALAASIDQYTPQLMDNPESIEILICLRLFVMTTTTILNRGHEPVRPEVVAPPVPLFQQQQQLPQPPPPPLTRQQAAQQLRPQPIVLQHQSPQQVLVVSKPEEAHEEQQLLPVTMRGANDDDWDLGPEEMPVLRAANDEEQEEETLPMTPPTSKRNCRSKRALAIAAEDDSFVPRATRRVKQEPVPARADEEEDHQERQERQGQQKDQENDQLMMMTPPKRKRLSVRWKDEDEDQELEEVMMTPPIVKRPRRSCTAGKVAKQPKMEPVPVRADEEEEDQEELMPVLSMMMRANEEDQEQEESLAMTRRSRSPPPRVVWQPKKPKEEPISYEEEEHQEQQEDQEEPLMMMSPPKKRNRRSVRVKMEEEEEQEYQEQPLVMIMTPPTVYHRPKRSCTAGKVSKQLKQPKKEPVGADEEEEKQKDLLVMTPRNRPSRSVPSRVKKEKQERTPLVMKQEPLVMMTPPTVSQRPRRACTMSARAASQPKLSKIEMTRSHSAPKVASQRREKQQCAHCDQMIAPDWTTMFRHIWRNHKDQVYRYIKPDLVCQAVPYCDYVASSVTGRKMHETRVHGKQPEPIDIQEFKTKGNCPYCHSALHRIGYVKTHLKQCKARDGRPLLHCSTCPDAKFNFVCEFVAHLEAHDDVEHGRPVLEGTQPSRVMNVNL